MRMLAEVECAVVLVLVFVMLQIVVVDVLEIVEIILVLHHHVEILVTIHLALEHLQHALEIVQFNVNLDAEFHLVLHNVNYLVMLVVKVIFVLLALV